ncbi:hypothetical protein BV898_17501 [Hypsibius exemplaris]|uniref:Uncharacterized protein n=1 Tax=Hypsibius exemplaris TaxID=2072580 RepID=A0A9X6NMD8_HYPEX|nr:hypothetical protein BV898_17501 [Hypsibius exemplaris]
MRSLVINAVILIINTGAVLGFLQGRATCTTTYNRTASVTTSAFACSNCYRLTNAAANASCAATYCSKPTLVNTGTSSVVVPCNIVGDLVQGPQFIIPTPSTNYYVDVQVVSSSSQSAAGTTSYLSYNPITGYIQIGVAGPENIDVTQVYSVVLINRATGVASDPVYFTAKIYTCTMYIVGPKSFSVCVGLTTPYLGSYTNLSYTACNRELLTNGVQWDRFNPTTGVLTAVGAGPCTVARTFSPFVTAFTLPGDNDVCYINDRQTGNPEFFSRGGSKSLCVALRCITPGFGRFIPGNFYNAAQLNVFSTTYGIDALAPTGVADVAGCTIVAPATVPPRGATYCGTCLPIPASILSGAVGPAVADCTAADTFTQTLSVTGFAPSFQNGIVSGITVTYDSTCNSLDAFNVVC